jgi:hypothetical protein
VDGDGGGAGKSGDDEAAPGLMAWRIRYPLAGLLDGDRHRRTDLAGRRRRGSCWIDTRRSGR